MLASNCTQFKKTLRSAVHAVSLFIKTKQKDCQKISKLSKYADIDISLRLTVSLGY